MTKQEMIRFWNALKSKYEAAYIETVGQAMWDSLTPEQKTKGFRMCVKNLTLGLCETEEERANMEKEIEKWPEYNF
jgi:hypothetical protein